MGIKKVELLKDKIREYLLNGYSLTATEKELGLAKNDIQKYYKQITGEDPKDFLKEAKKKKLLGKTEYKDSKLIKTKNTQEVEILNIIKRIEYIEKRIDELEKFAKKSKFIESINDKPSLFEEFIATYYSGEKTIYSIRILKFLKDKLIKQAKKNNLSANQLTNLILYEYFKKEKE